ncbi:MAG: hypothetical protein J1F40_06985 [Prevotellaceae bacterium]|nr:hypothetical protein [Prevotellaceae bacterium]
MSQTKYLNVIPECYVDTNLIEYLLHAGVNHQHCCSKVVGLLKGTFKDKFAVGIIDKDKVVLGYVNECDTLARTEHLTLMKHKTLPQYIITVYPAIDRFVLDCAEEQKVNPKDFKLPSDLDAFTKESKAVTSNRDPRFKELFKAIKGNDEIRKLKAVLKHLCDNAYNADEETLKSIFEKGAIQ